MIIFLLWYIKNACTSFDNESFGKHLNEINNARSLCDQTSICTFTYFFKLIYSHIFSTLTFFNQNRQQRLTNILLVTIRIFCI